MGATGIQLPQLPENRHLAEHFGEPVEPLQKSSKEPWERGDKVAIALGLRGEEGRGHHAKVVSHGFDCVKMPHQVNPICRQFFTPLSLPAVSGKSATLKRVP